MKQTILLFTTALFFATSLFAQVVYVDASADGGNNGSSWANAFTTLETALAAAASGEEVWIASATYLAPSNSFFVTKNLTLIGGFAGTESSADQANPLTNPTILSGDVNGDDSPGNVQANRFDNRQIMRVDSLLDLVTIRNLTFSGGQLGITPPGANIEDFSGGSLRSYSPLDLSECVFTSNGANYGAAVALFGAHNSHIRNITASNNYASGRGVIFAIVSDNLRVANATISNNLVNFGSLHVEESFNATIDSSLFENNFALDRAAAVSFAFSPGARLTNTTINANECAASGIGGALSIVGRNGDARPTDLTENLIDNCQFSNNQGRLGGAGVILAANVLVRNTTLSGNTSFALGGGFTIVNTDTDQATNIEDKLIRFEQCIIEENTVSGAPFYGGGLYLEEAYSLEIDSCLIANNGNVNHEIGGGIMITGDAVGTGLNQNVTITATDFTGNQSPGLLSGQGGALFLQSATGFINLNVDNSRFQANSASNSGGAISMRNSVVATFNEIESFQNNAGSIGGFIGTFVNTPLSGDGSQASSVTINSSRIYQNFANFRGGAISLDDIDLVAKNNLFYANGITATDSTNFGGAINLTADTSLQTSLLVNNTFYLNTASDFGGDVSVFSNINNDEGALELTIQNNAFASLAGFTNVGIQNTAENDPEEITITTTGGNFFPVTPLDFTPLSTDVVTTGQSLTALFNNAIVLSNPDFRPNRELENNPIINTGTTGPDVPATDILGVNRDENPEIGAHESRLPTVAEIIAASSVHTQLTDFLNQANLTGTLNGTGPFTVLAPTDAAFDLLPQTTLDLLAQGDNLSNTLLTHVIDGEFREENLVNGFIVPSLAPATDLVFTNDNGITVTTYQGDIANLTLTDLVGSNGVVHVIDAVLIPAAVNVLDFKVAMINAEFYPNPVQNTLSVSINEPSFTELQVAVIDLNGRRLSNYTLNNGLHSIDCSTLPPGIYTLEILTGGQTYFKKMVKQ